MSQRRPLNLHSVAKLLLLKNTPILLGDLILVSLKELTGKKVVTTDAYTIGEVDGVE